MAPTKLSQILSLLSITSIVFGAEPPIDPKDTEYYKVFIKSPERLDTDQNKLPTIVTRKRKTPPTLIDEPPAKKRCIELTDIPYPKDIHKELTQYTIGQNDAMSSLSIFIHAHLINMKINSESANLESPPIKSMDKSNILMVGPTGCGKTSTLEVLAKYLKTPLVVGNATEWTPQGYIGQKWQEIFEDLWIAAKKHLDQDGKDHTINDYIGVAQKSIIFIDEIDKLCPGLDSKKIEIFERVQQELLPVLQGTKVTLKNGTVLNTSSILFIAGGAFAALTSKEGASKKITAHDLHRYGMLPELAGRLSNIVQFGPLDKSHLKEIIQKSKHSFLTQYQFIFKTAYDIHLTFDETAIDFIAEMASKQLTGARAIGSMINKIMKDVLFNIQDHIGKPLIITREIADKALGDYSPVVKEDDKPPFGMYT